MEPLTILILTTLGSAFGAYLAGYMKKKGEHLATHEDIDKLTDQVAAVTKTTKEIEAQIASGLWDRQKRWELKREVLFEATKRLAAVDDALNTYSSALRLELNKQVQKDSSAWLEEKLGILAKWSKASTAFDETKLFVGVVCGKETRDAVDALWEVVTRIGKGISKDVTVYENARPEIYKKLLTVREAIRKELGIDALDQQTPTRSA
jgi:hypothetical protein